MEGEKYLELFKREANELIRKMDDTLLELEKAPTNLESINEFFRGAHSIKGMAASMNFNNISELAHSMEDLMAGFRSGKIASEEDIDLLFRGVDELKELIGKAGTKELKEIDVQLLIKDFRDRTEGLKEAKLRKKEEGKEEVKLGKKEEEEEEEEPTPQKVIPKIKRIETIKLNVNFLDNLMDLVGELLINKNRLQMLVFEYKVSGSEEALTQLGMLLDDLQNQVFQARLLPIDYILNQFPRVVRDLSREENKKVELELRGANTEMDKAILDSLSEPLIHLIRNAVDHGIEKPEERKRKGKREVGKIWIRAKREQNSIVMEVEDDGGGIDIEAIKQRGLEKELIGAKASEEEILNLLFIPGFSGAKKITRVSGRGVGMDVVREVVESLKGSVSIRTQKGKGTKVSLTLPFTTAISKALIVRANGNKYGILLHDIQSTINLEKAKIRGVENKKVVLLRDTIAPLIDLQQLFLGEEREKKPLGKYGIIIKDENRSAVIEVEDILGQQELVVRPLTPLLGSIKFFSGTAILGDGTVILTLNPASILSSGKS